MSQENIEQCMEGIKQQVQALMEQAYQRGYKAGQEIELTVVSEKCIDQGRNEAWDAVCKILRMSEKEYSSLFDTDCTNSYYRLEKLLSMSVLEAIQLVSEYEQKNKNEQEEIHVGDEVITVAGDKGVVIGISNNDVFLFISGWKVPQVKHKLCCKKTGRAFPEIVETLKKIEEDEK